MKIDPELALRLEPGGALEVFRERLQQPGYQHLLAGCDQARRRASRRLLEELAALFLRYSFQAAADGDGVIFGDGQVSIAVDVARDGWIQAWAANGEERQELDLARWARRNLFFDPHLEQWLGPVVKTAQLMGHEPVYEAVRNPGAPGAPVVRLSALETLAELVFGCLREAAKAGREV